MLLEPLAAQHQGLPFPFAEVEAGCGLKPSSPDELSRSIFQNGLFIMSLPTQSSSKAVFTKILYLF
jgi:hypothetical protein